MKLKWKIILGLVLTVLIGVGIAAAIVLTMRRDDQASGSVPTAEPLDHVAGALTH